MLMLRFARECIYICWKEDQTKRAYSEQQEQQHTEREKESEINPLGAYSSLNVRHTFDGFSRENEG